MENKYFCDIFLLRCFYLEINLCQKTPWEIQRKTGNCYSVSILKCTGTCLQWKILGPLDKMKIPAFIMANLTHHSILSELTLLRVGPSVVSKVWGGKRIYNFQMPRTTPTIGLKKASFLGASEVRKGPPLWKLGKLDQLLFFLWKRWHFIESKVL